MLCLLMDGTKPAAHTAFFEVLLGKTKQKSRGNCKVAWEKTNGIIPAENALQQEAFEG